MNGIVYSTFLNESINFTSDFRYRCHPNLNPNFSWSLSGLAEVNVTYCGINISSLELDATSNTMNFGEDPSTSIWDSSLTGTCNVLDPHLIIQNCSLKIHTVADSFSSLD